MLAVAPLLLLVASLVSPGWISWITRGAWAEQGLPIPSCFLAAVTKGQEEALSPSAWSLIPVSSLISRDGNGRIRGCSHILTGVDPDGWSHVTLLENLPKMIPKHSEE